MPFRLDAAHNAVVLAEAPPDSHPDPNFRAFLSFDPLLRFEVSRWLQPSGPLSWADLSSKNIDLTPYAQEAPASEDVPFKGVGRLPVKWTPQDPADLFAALKACCEKLASSNGKKSAGLIPVSTHTKPFWMTYINWFKTLGANDTSALLKNPTLCGELLDVKNGSGVDLRLGAATWEQSMRLSRQFGFAYFMRVKVSKSFMWKMQSSSSFKSRVRQLLMRDFVRVALSIGATLTGIPVAYRGHGLRVSVSLFGSTRAKDSLLNSGYKDSGAFSDCACSIMTLLHSLARLQGLEKRRLLLCVYEHHHAGVRPEQLGHEAGQVCIEIGAE
jgi:hypothetical protein